MSTYQQAPGVDPEDQEAALLLYAWNTAISGAFLGPLQICEVVIRNAVSEALVSVYGERWPWSQSFERSLTSPRHGYNHRQGLVDARRAAHTAGQAIAELNFFFWQKLFTSRYDARLWDPYLRVVMPSLNKDAQVDELRVSLYNDMQQIRQLRNRIAHHEPIFKRNLDDDYSKILGLVQARCPETADWLDTSQNVTTLLATRP